MRLHIVAELGADEASAGLGGIIASEDAVITVHSIDPRIETEHTRTREYLPVETRPRRNILHHIMHTRE